MNQNVTENAFGVSAFLPEFYTAVHSYCGIPMLRSILLKNVPEDVSGELTVRIIGSFENVKVIDFAEKFPDFSVSNYVCDNPACIPLNLEKNRILPSAKFINSITGKVTVRIQMCVEFADLSASTFADVKFMPLYLIPAKMSPELLCAYVEPGCDFARRISGSALLVSKKINEKNGGKLPRELALSMALFSLLQNEKLTYSASISEIFDTESRLRSPDAIMTSASRAVSLTEAALIFASCAERCGLSVSIIYLRKGAGSVRVLIGVELAKRECKRAVSESISELRERILSKEIFVLDVLGFLSTESTDFARNVSETVQLIFKTSSTLSFSVDVALSRLCGVASLSASKDTPKGKLQNYESLTESIKKIEQNEVKNVLYGYSPYTSASLGLICKNKLKMGKTYTLTPLDDEIFTSDPDAISLITTFDGKYDANKSRNNAEQSLYVSKLRALNEKIIANEKKDILHAYPSRYFLKCEKPTFDKTRDEFLSDSNIITENTANSAIKGSSLDIFAAVGIMEILEGDKTLFVPCVFVPCALSVSDGVTKLTYGTESPVFNKCLCSYLTGKFALDDEFMTPDKNGDITVFLSRLKKLAEKYRGIKFHSDTLISCFDLSYTFMRECLEKAEGGKFEKYIESGKYEFSNEGKTASAEFESTLPFECPSNLRNAVRYAESDSIIISGPVGSGKKKAVANIISRAAKNDDNILVCSKYRDSLDSLLDVMNKADLSELCLIAENADETKNKIRGDLEKLTSLPVKPEKETDTDINTLKTELDVYAEELYAPYNFGYSLYDCIEEYCKYDSLAQGAPAEIQADVSELKKDGTAKLFALAQSLSESYCELLPALGGKTLSYYGLGHIRATSQVQKDVLKSIEAAINELSAFNEKSAFARKTLGFTDTDITDMKSFSALGELFELIMKSGIDYIPEGLFKGSSYRNAKCIEDFATVCSELCKTDKKLEDITKKNSAISSSELYEKWCREESKATFVKEFKKNYSDKLSRRDMLDTVKLLDIKERLESEMLSVSKDAKDILGSIFDGKNTDTEKVSALADFALRADVCVNKIMRSDDSDFENFGAGISNLVSALFSDSQVNADFVLSAASFRNLTDTSDKEGHLEKISKALSIDTYDIKFEDGLLTESGLSKLLSIWKDNIDIILLLPKYNAAKKEAIAKGLCGFVQQLENSIRSDAALFLKKSIFAHFAKYIINSRPCLESRDIPEKCKTYCELYSYEKKLAACNLISCHREKMKKYLSTAEGRSALYALNESLSDTEITASGLLSRHSLILSQMYPAILMTLPCAFRQRSSRPALVLLDCEKTAPCEGLALCAGFDRCTFISSAFETAGSIISSLPLGIAQVDLTHFGAEKIGLVSSFVKESYFGEEYTYTCECDTSRVKFIKCEGGLYDKSTLTNKIEAVKACETAYEYALHYGFENVGILAFTTGQVAEINRALAILAGKYSDKRIGAIPARYTGNMGDLSKKCIILSATFGKNIYSVTRSYGDLDDMAMSFSASPISFEKLLCAESLLCVVSSVEPEEIPVCTANIGAPAFKKLLEFAKYRASRVKVSGSSNIPSKIIREYENENASRIYSFDGAVAIGNTAALYSDRYIRDTYDRIVLPRHEYELHEYNAEFCNIFDLLK